MFIFGKSSLKDQRKVTSWLKEYIGNPDELKVQMVVKEVNCTDPECVPLETVCILVNSDNNDRWIGKILKPLNEVMYDDMKTLNIPIQWLTTTTTTTTTNDNNDNNDYYNNDPFVKDTINRLKDYLSNLNDQKEQENVMNIFENLFKEVRTTATRTAILNPSTIIINDTTTNDSSSSSSSIDIKSYTNEIQMEEEKVEEVEVEDELMDVVVIDMEAAPPPPKDTTTTATASSGSSSSSSSSTSSSSYREDKFGRSRPQIRDTSSSMPTKRHDKGIRPRGCPCCDPDNLENLIDLYMGGAI